MAWVRRLSTEDVGGCPVALCEQLVVEAGVIRRRCLLAGEAIGEEDCATFGSDRWRRRTPIDGDRGGFVVIMVGRSMAAFLLLASAVKQSIRIQRALSITFRKPPKSVFCAVFSSHHRQS